MGLFKISQILIWLCFAYGTVFGSFINVVAYRLPRNESIIFPRSHCPNCQHTLTPYELIPVLSWIGLRGKCRHCKAAVSIRYPVIELATGILWALSASHMATWGQLGVWLLFWLYLMTIVGTDLTAMVVPNILSLPAAVVFLLGSGFTHLQSWPMAAAGMVVGYGVIWLIHWISRGRMGLGDAKLYLSIGAMLGPWLTIESFILACVFGLIVGIGLRFTSRLSRGEYFAFVPYIAIATIVTAFYGEKLIQMYIQLL